MNGIEVNPESHFRRIDDQAAQHWNDDHTESATAEARSTAGRPDT